MGLDILFVQFGQNICFNNGNTNLRNNDTWENISYRFLRNFFRSIVTQIKSIFPGGARYPLLPTRLNAEHDQRGFDENNVLCIYRLYSLSRVSAKRYIRYYIIYIILFRTTTRSWEPHYENN